MGYKTLQHRLAAVNQICDVEDKSDKKEAVIYKNTFMQYITKLKLAAVHQFCDIEDKSTEYMYQLMQDTCKVDIDTVNNYMVNENHEKLFKEVNELLELIIKIEEDPHNS